MPNFYASSPISSCLKTALLIFLGLALTACAPALKVSRSGTSVRASTLSLFACAPIDDLREVAQEECRRTGKSITSPIPRSVSSGGNACRGGKAHDAFFDCGAAPDNSRQVSRLELRAMQTRKFAKPPQTVASSINELYKDKSQQCVGVRAPTYACPSGISHSKIINGKPTTYCANSDGTPAAEQKMIKHVALNPDGVCLGGGYQTTFSLDTNYPESTTTTLRIRVSNFLNRSQGEAQSTDPAVYNKIFKEIADGLFIDAIELTPAEMQ
jgi:hypothetical protein